IEYNADSLINNDSGVLRATSYPYFESSAVKICLEYFISRLHESQDCLNPNQIDLIRNSFYQAIRLDQIGPIATDICSDFPSIRPEKESQ
uniref:hypothetical protein n=1 Tax=Faecalibaculum rodentium TaxID=1702221 RepID=UPI0023EFE4F1